MAAVPDTLNDFKRGMAEEFLRKTGFLHLQVLGQSMLPGIWPGDVLTIETKIANEMEIGDIGLFRRNARFFVHRIKNKLIMDGSLHLLARGDSAGKNDPPFPPVPCWGELWRSIMEIGSRSPFVSLRCMLACWDGSLPAAVPRGTLRCDLTGKDEIAGKLLGHQ